MKDNERERAKIIAAISGVETARLRLLRAAEVAELSGSTLSRDLIVRIKREYLRGREGTMVSGKNERKEKRPTAGAVGAQLVLEDLAVIAANSEFHKGADGDLSELDVVKLLCRRLVAHDPSLLKRAENRKRRLRSLASSLSNPKITD